MSGIYNSPDGPRHGDGKPVGRPRTPPPRNWRTHPMMSVTGCIDSNGAITARASTSIRVHGPAESRGRRWRWLIWSQEFAEVRPANTAEANNMSAMHMTREEVFAVWDWLRRNDYTDDRTMPRPRD
jgi:hypothetical protein